MRSLTFWAGKPQTSGSLSTPAIASASRSVTERPDLLWMHVLADPDQDRCSVTFARGSLHRLAFNETQDEELTSQRRVSERDRNHHCHQVHFDHSNIIKGLLRQNVVGS